MTFGDFGRFPDAAYPEEGFRAFIPAEERRTLAQGWWEEKLRAACHDREPPHWPDDFSDKSEWIRLCQLMVEFLAETKATEPELFKHDFPGCPDILNDRQRAGVIERSNARAALRLTEPAEQQRLYDVAAGQERDREFVAIATDYLIGRLKEIDRFYAQVPDRNNMPDTDNDRYLVASTTMSMHGWSHPTVTARIKANYDNIALTQQIAESIFRNCCEIAREIYGTHLSSDQLRLLVDTRSFAPTEFGSETIYPASMVYMESGEHDVFEFGEPARRERYMKTFISTEVELQVKVTRRQAGTPFFQLKI